MTGTARVGRRTAALIKRLRPGDIAVIDHTDLDKISADALLTAKVSAVVNVGTSTSGRYPNLGPQTITDAGVPLLDVEGSDLLSRVHDGDRLLIDGPAVYRDGVELVSGRLLDPAGVTDAMQDARSGMSMQLESLTANAQEFIRRERELLLDGGGVPEVRTELRGRHVVVVVRAYDYESDLQQLRTYLREQRPVLIGVGAGADALIEAGHRPALVIGDGDTLSDAALASGAEIVLHQARGSRPMASERFERLGVRSVPFASSGTTEDAAMLLADTHGAELVVAVGSHNTLVEFLDKGRSTVASTFITRLRLGATLVDAKSVHRLYRPAVRTWQLLLVALIALLAVVLAVAMTPVGQPWWQDFQNQISELGTQLRRPFT
ncbi:MAG TPA: putative cytokinetic ring protein SteA [Nocardioidaceae bacterium]|nr:putative cytokinetic ring protein SteA [Nocardioidaceae bacterium]